MKTEEVRKMLADYVEKDRIIDVGRGCAEKHNISREKLWAATAQMVDEGYHIYYVAITRTKGTEKVAIKLLTASDVTPKEAWTELQKRAGDNE